jgi:septal ring factor EnvC (AmiA/AmiB activator)
VELVEDQEDRVTEHQGQATAVLDRAADLENDLAVLDAELAAAERARDAARQALADPARRLTYLEALRVAEDRDAAQARVAELRGQRRIVADYLARLTGAPA